MNYEIPGLAPTLAKVLIPLAVIVIVLRISRRRGVAWDDTLGIRAPGRVAVGLALWAAYVAWMLGTNAAMGWRGPWDFTVWRLTPPAIAALRVLAVGVLGPASEELVVRGLLFGRLVRTRLGVWGTILLTSAGWALLHYTYTPGVIAVIFVSGLLLALARYRTGSLLFPVLMHVTWNLFAVW